MKILIVDDDYIVLKSLKVLIPWQDIGISEVLDAKNGEVALKLAHDKKPDIIITDIRMPVMDGLELARRISEEMADIPIIILSAHEDFGYAKQAMKFGIKSYILKPLDRDNISQLCEEVKNLVAIKKSKNNALRRINGEELEASIIEALNKSDLSYLRKVFEEDFCDAGITIEEVRSLCIKLINILLSYFQHIGIKNKPLIKSKADIFDNFYRLKLRKEMIDYIYQLYLDVLQFIDQSKDNHSDGIMKCIISLIHENYSDYNLNVSYISEKLNLSQSYLSHLSRRHMGINISSYITQVRIEKAKEFLKNPSIPISEVSSKTGYSDANYFAKVFKKIVGKSPSEYRNLALNMRENSI